MTATPPRPVALIILDGYGHNPDPANNAVEAANTPVMDRLWAEHPRTLIHTDGRHVGLPDGQMGNSLPPIRTPRCAPRARPWDCPTARWATPRWAT